MNNIGKAITLWGVITFVGFAIFQWWQPDPFFANAVLAWIPLTLLGLVGIVKLVPNWQKLPVVKVWFAVGIVGMLVNIAQTLFKPALIPIFMPFTNFWLLLMGIGYLATGVTWKKSSKTYYAGGVLNLVVLALMMGKMFPLPMYSILATGVVGALPALYDGLTNYKV